MRLKISETLWQPLVEGLLARTDVESAGLLLARADTKAKALVAVEAKIVPDDAFTIRRYDQLQIDPVALNRLTRRARDEELSIFTIHTHPMGQEPWFSSADDRGDRRLMPSFNVQVPRVPHGSLVVVPGGVPLGRWFDGDAGAHELDIDIVGKRLRRFPEPAVADEEYFARQQLALGPYGQALLRRLRGAIIGLGGTGSIVAPQLIHLGVGDLLFMDGDVVSATNMSRVYGATTKDIDKTNKADVAARYAVSTGLPVNVEVVRSFLDGDETLARLRSCDFVISAVDRHTPRALLNRLAYEAAIPVIDLGTAFRVDKEGRMTGDSGRVVVVGPGRPCLACWGHIDPRALQLESLSDEQRAQEEALGYVDGARVAQPSVVAFNTMAAGAAVIELLRLVTGFAGADDPPNRLSFSFRDGTVRRNSMAAVRSCRICSNHLPHTQ